MDKGIRSLLAERLEKANGSLDIGIHRIERGFEARSREALGGQVEYIIRLRFGDDVLDRDIVTQITIDQKHPIASIYPANIVADIVHRAAPTDHSVNIPICILEQKIEKMGTDHSGNAGDKATLWAVACHVDFLIGGFELADRVPDPTQSEVRPSPAARLTSRKAYPLRCSAM